MKREVEAFDTDLYDWCFPSEKRSREQEKELHIEGSRWLFRCVKSTPDSNNDRCASVARPASFQKAK